MRALRERVVSAAAIIEDGSASKARNLVDEYQKATLDQLQLTDGATALAFFKRHPAAEFKRLRAAIKLPPRPDYYSDNMDLSIVVDRGDVWYDLPFDAERPLQAAAAQEVPAPDAVHEGGRQAGRAGALAHHDRRLALGAGDATATNTSATRGRTSARA